MDAPQTLEMRLVYPRYNGRPVDKKAVARLATSFEAIGLQTPITVRPVKRTVNTREIDAFEIVAGRHRYEAAVNLKWQRIAAFVQPWDDDDASLWEIDENLIRAELTDAQRADHHARRRDILVKKGLVHAPAGGRPKKGDKLSSYADEAAATLSVDRRTIQRDLARGSKITPAVLAEVAGTDMDKGVVLDTLARTPTAEQPRVLAELQQERSRVPLAKPPLRDAEVVEQQLAALTAAWNRAGPEARERFRAKIGAA